MNKLVLNCGMLGPSKVLNTINPRLTFEQACKNYKEKTEEMNDFIQNGDWLVNSCKCDSSFMMYILYIISPEFSLLRANNAQRELGLFIADTRNNLVKDNLFKLLGFSRKRVKIEDMQSFFDEPQKIDANILERPEILNYICKLLKKNICVLYYHDTEVKRIESLVTKGAIDCQWILFKAVKNDDGEVNYTLFNSTSGKTITQGIIDDIRSNGFLDGRISKTMYLKKMAGIAGVSKEDLIAST